jgi:predicted ferric reductase
MKRTVGTFMIIAPCIVTCVLWLLADNVLASIQQTPYRALSQIFSLLGIVLMSITFLFATKLSFLEEIFGGLDKDYFIHHIIGLLSFIFIINHPLLLAIQALPSLSTAQNYVYFSNELSYNFGIIALYTMILSFISLLFLKLRHEKWIVMHDILAVSYAFAVTHVLFIPSTVSESLPLKLWIMIFLIIGSLSAVYKIFLYQKFGPKFLYTVASVTKQNDIINILLSPHNKRINFYPGQFVYIKCISKAVPPQMHPFSPSTTALEDQIRITVKALGDYTKKLEKLSIGDKVFVYGPHGRFAEVYKSKPRTFIWVAGGIGVTPFVALLHAEAIKPSGHTIYFFYATRTPQEQVFLSEIQAILTVTPGVKLIPWSSETNGRLDAKKISEICGIPIQDAIVLICGPLPMMLSLNEQFLDLGLDEEQIIFEQFNFV